MNKVILNKNIRLNYFNKMCSIPKNMDFDELDKNSIIDLRNKKYSLDNISEDDSSLTLVLQPNLQTATDLETNIFDAYPVSNIPFSYSNSWIGM